MTYRLAFIIVAMAMTVLACGGDSAPPVSTGNGDHNVGSGVGPGISITEAAASDLEGPLLVNGWLWQESDGDVRLCTTLTDSVPPECGEPSLIVAGLDLNAADGLLRDQGVLWSQEQVQLLGEVSGGVLTVAPLSLAD